MMSGISDEIREWFDISPHCEGTFIDQDDCKELRDLADRIDSETVELPKDAEGVPIHVGDTVYLDDGRKAEVTHIDLWQGESSIDFSACGNFFVLAPEHFTHTRPDSWECIADELDAWFDGYAEGMADAVEPVAEWYRRHADWGEDG